MNVLRRRKRGFATLTLVLFLFITCAAFAGLKLAIEKIPRKKIPGASVIYIPSGKFLKYATLGYSSIVADLVYLWAIQYYSTYTIVDRFQYLMHIFSIIAELDPTYTDPYEIGALIAAHEAKDLNLAYQILDLGLAKNPDQWFFPFQAGHFAQLAKDFETARKYYEKTMKIPGSPDFVKRLYAAASYKIMDLKTAWEIWLEVYNTAADKRTKKIASNHLYRVKAATDIGLIKEATEKFREKYGRLPAALAELAERRIIASLPQDMDGKDYVYDPKTGAVEAPTIWWKRSS
jgi:tetratricopeptide (TPR) repeat protein